MATNNSEVLSALQKARQPKEKKPYKGLAKVSPKRAKQIEEDKKLQAQDKDFYLEIWANAPHKCYNCNCGLGNVVSNYMFHHLLPKSQYPQFRHEPINIAILCLQCHSKIETNADFAPKVKQLMKEAKKQLL